MRNLVIGRSTVVRFVERLHRGEEGMETVQIIMIMAIAAMILTGVGSVAGVKAGGTPTGSGLLSVVSSGLGTLLGSSKGGGFLSGLTSVFGG